MATYLSGVTDYIPQFQPFQPDLNLYANVLQTKQTKYDSNYKAINNIYGQYYHADLTRDTNIQRKDELIKNIDFNLQRVTGLDLSLEQNVQQATQVFKPFYEDQYLMKDMAWTKNYNSQRGRAEGLKNSQDEKLRAQYWETGVRAMDYNKEEFKELGDQGSLSFGNTAYTPYVNVTKKAQEIAKEAGLSIETVDFSPDQRWIVTNKNGEQLMEPLSKLFEASLGSDPAVQAVYKTQAYVNRKDYSYSNAAQFGGDRNAAEMKYLEESYTMLKQQNDARYNQLKSTSGMYDKKIADIEKQIKNGKAAPGSEEYLEQLKQSKNINQSVLSRIESDNEKLADDLKTRETTGGFQNPYGDVESLRWKVDSAMASILMEKDLDEAAQIFAFKDAKQSVQANPYAVNEQKFQFDKALVHMRGSYQLETAKLRNAGDRKNMLDKYKLDSGAYGLNPETGEVEMLPGYDDIFTEAVNKGNVTDKINLKELSRADSKRQTSEVAVPYFNGMLTQLKIYKEQGVITDQQISQILGYKGKQKVSLDDFSKAMGSDEDSQYKFIRGTLGTNELTGINKRFNTWVSQNSKLDAVSSNMQTFKQLSNSMNDYVGYLQEDQKWRTESSRAVVQQLESQGFKEAKYLYDEKGNLRSRDQFYQILSSKGTSTGDAKKDIKVAEYKKLMEESSRITSAYRGDEKNSFYNNVQARRKAANDPRLKEIAAKQRKIVEEIGGISVSDLGKANASEYDKLINEAGKAYTNTQVIKAPPAIANMGSLTGTGLFTPGIQSILVTPKAINTKGMAYFREFASDMNRIDFGDNQKFQVSFTGATKGAMDKVMSGDDMTNALGEKLIKDLITNANYGKSKISPFKLSAQAIAGGKAGKSAMIITPDKEWLDAYVATNKEEDNNMLSKEDYNNILRNGISVIADKENFKNTLLTSTYQDPLQMYVDRNDKYKWTDPNGYGSWTVEKNKFGTSQYIETLEYMLYNPDTGKMQSFVTSDMTNFGNKLSTQRDNISIGFFDDLATQNRNLRNGR